MTRALCRPLTIGAMLLVVAACQGDTTAPSESSDGGGARLAGQAPAAAPGDTVGSSGSSGGPTAPSTPAPRPSPDTAYTTPPAQPGASVIELRVYVGIAVPGVDTLRSTPAANARVNVLSRTFTRSTGPDTLTVTESLVASATTDALGKASFASLPSAGYRIEAVVDGQRGSPASIQIAPPYQSTVATSIIIRPTP